MPRTARPPTWSARLDILLAALVLVAAGVDALFHLLLLGSLARAFLFLESVVSTALAGICEVMDGKWISGQCSGIVIGLVGSVLNGGESARELHELPITACKAHTQRRRHTPAMRLPQTVACRLCVVREFKASELSCAEATATGCELMLSL